MVDIKAWFTDGKGVEHEVPGGSPPNGKIMVEIKSGDITQNNAKVTLTLTILPFGNLAGQEVDIEVTKKD